MILRPSRRALITGAAVTLAMPYVARAGSLSLLGAGKPVSGGGGGGGFAPISHAAHGSTDGNGFTIGPMSTTGANFIVLGVASFGGGYTLADNQSNGAPTGLSSLISGSNVLRLFYYFAPTVGASHTFTLTGTSVFPTMFVASFATALSTPFDTENSAATASGTSIQDGASVTPAQANELVITLAGTGGSSHTVDGGFTTTDTIDHGANDYGGGMAFLKQTTATAVRPTWSWTTASVGMTVLGTFKFS